LQFLPWFEKAQFKLTVAPFIDGAQLQRYYDTGSYGVITPVQVYWRRFYALLKLNRYKVVWIEKEALPWLPAWLEIWLLKRVPYVLDYDDAIFHNYDQHTSTWVRYILGRRIDRVMASSALVVAGNAYLAKRAIDAGARWVEIVPTVIDLNRYTAKPVNQLQTKDPLRIVWIGSPSTMKFLELLQRPLESLGRRFDFRLRVIAGSSIEMPGVDVEFVPWTEATEAASIQACDIGVMPLLDSDWERGKCGYKLIQYMACGLPVVASSVGANCEIVHENKNGFLAKNSDDWESALSKLLTDSDLRHQMGASGRKYVEAEYCVQKVAPKLIAMLNKVSENE